jgi:hypothetical protein
MRCTDTQLRLLVSQLRKARDEVARARMMMAVQAEDDEDLEVMVAELSAVIDAIVKAAELEDEDGEDGEEDGRPGG